MSGGYVFDTEAIIAYLYNEPGHEAVADLLDEVFSGETDGVLTETNASEVFYLVAQFEGVNDAPTDASLREQTGIFVHSNGKSWSSKQPTGDLQLR